MWISYTFFQSTARQFGLSVFKYIIHLLSRKWQTGERTTEIESSSCQLICRPRFRRYSRAWSSGSEAGRRLDESYEKSKQPIGDGERSERWARRKLPKSSGAKAVTCLVWLRPPTVCRLVAERHFAQLVSLRILREHVLAISRFSFVINSVIKVASHRWRCRVA